MQKSKKLVAEEQVAAEERAAHQSASAVAEVVAAANSIAKVREIPCCNEFVAVLQDEYKIDSKLEIQGEAKYINEGMVVGVGPGTASNGARVPSQLALGDRIMFSGNQVLMITPSGGTYQGRKVIIINERQAICKLPAVPFEIIEA